MKRILYFLFAFLLAPAPSLQAQQPEHDTKTNYAGKDFWITLYSRSRYNDFFISSKHNATVTFTFTSNNTTQTVNVAAGTILRVPLTLSQVISIIGTQIEMVQNMSLHISADSNIVVHYAAWGNRTDDGTVVYPSDRQIYNKVYFLNGLPALPSAGVNGSVAGSYSIVATCDNVSLRITPSRNTALHTAATPFQIMLNKGQTYTIANSGSNVLKDLGGTKIEVLNAECCNPINVFNTSMCGYGYWPYNGSSAPLACDLFLEQVLPVSSWDTLYPAVPYENGPYSIFKIVSSAANNKISLNGNTIATLAEGQCLDTILKHPGIFSADFPISVSQNMVGQGVAYAYPGPVAIDTFPVDSMSDPNSTILVPVRDGIREAYFHTIGQYEPANSEYYAKFHRLVLISRTENVNTITLNNVSVAPYFMPFSSSPDYQYAVITPDTGMMYHLVSDDRIIAYYYACAWAGSFDFNLADPTPVRFYNELPPDTLQACIKDTLLLQGGEAAFFEWSTGETSQDIKVTDTGTYFVYRLQDDDCIGDRKEFVIERPQTYIREFDLGGDTVICKGDYLVLSTPYMQTEWSTGVIGDQVKVQAPGWYYAVITDSCNGYTFKDSILVNDTLCLSKYCDFNLPNAFSPNGDGLNELFMPVFFGVINQYNMSIYNRFGERVFNAQKVGQGWDGTHNGTPADIGTYYYHCRYYCPLRGYIESKGDVTLLR